MRKNLQRIVTLKNEPCWKQTAGSNLINFSKLNKEAKNHEVTLYAAADTWFYWINKAANLSTPHPSLASDNEDLVKRCRIIN